MKTKIKPIKSFDDLPLIIDVTFASFILNCSKDTIQKLCKSGKLNAVKIGREWRITKEALEKFVKGE